MDGSSLLDDYLRLRAELSSAYAEPVWDSERIDRIADSISPLELMFACAQRSSRPVPEGTAAETPPLAAVTPPRLCEGDTIAVSDASDATKSSHR